MFVVVVDHGLPVRGIPARQPPGEGDSLRGHSASMGHPSAGARAPRPPPPRVPQCEY